jgi:hypothetical protein
MYKFLLYSIIILHTLLILFITIIPFIGKNYLLFLHVLVGFTIIIHWITNNNACSLTIIEYKLREIISGKPVSRQDCFMARLIDPIYDLKKNNYSRRIFLYTVLITLTLISIYKLRRNYKNGNLKNLYDFYLK